MKWTPFLTLVLLACHLTRAQEAALVAKGAELTLLADGFEFTEGPAVAQNGDVYFTDQPNDRIVKWNAADNSVTDWMQPSGRSNGLYFGPDGALYACADEKNELWQIDANKKVTVLVSQFEGKKLGGPNDLWINGQGGIYFTDPFYKRSWWGHSTPEIKERRVYYLPAKGKTPIVVAKDFVNPNGIIGTADGKTLYIADIGDKKTYVFKVEKDGQLTDRSLFCNMGSDGMTLDTEGNVYLTGDGVTVFSPQGEKLHHIAVPEKWTANVTFGGPDRKTLFITAMDSVYTLEMAVAGAH
ncbi:SMP-30/gluconolactonase/LRE family protein [Maribacter sp. 2307ULW6-5]|uniref:SMP-30/gluconolactonase/LRE family protein n=1 Tax=Maribacter sp. 2307ULW6-5 TaxID=3386275 RepID=UPI0039BC447F